MDDRRLRRHAPLMEKRLDAAQRERNGVEAQEPQLRDLRLRTLRVRYSLEETTQAATVLLLHGAGLDHRQWRLLTPLLAASARVVAPDFPGFGDSERPRIGFYDFSPSTLATTVLDLMTALSLGRIVLVGHGLGAAVALTLATTKPEFVHALVLLSPLLPGGRRTVLERLATAPLLSGAASERLFGKRAIAIHRGQAPAPRDGLAARTLYDEEDGLHGRDDASFAALAALARDSTYGARLPRLRTPTVIVAGLHDPLISRRALRRLTRESDAIRLELLECGRTPECERPRDVAAIIRGVLAQPDTTRSTGRPPTTKR